MLPRPMLLAFDVGNTNITVGLYDGDTLVRSWRLESDHARTHDEYGLLVEQLLRQSGHGLEVVTGAIVASVVPVLARTFDHLVETLFDISALIVGPGLKTGMPILYNPPKDVGADRIVNGVAAFERFGTACIVVDFGTATTFDCITANGEYAGGAIAPGINISMDALFRSTAKLPRVDIDRPRVVVGKSTVESIQSGLYFGYVSLVDGLVDRIRAEMKADPMHVVATGGLAPVISKDSRTIESVDEGLTLGGLRLLYALNA